MAAKPTTLNQLLDDSLQLAPEYGEGLSSHLPMALVALRRLGADGRRLRTFAKGYTAAKHLQPAAAPAAWPAGDPWQARLGDFSAWPVYRHLFRDWIAHEGGVDVLTQVLPALMRGCGGVAFHGLIRTAYALDALHAAELADALAYWASRWMDLGLPVILGNETDPLSVLQGLALPHSREPLIATRMQTAARRRGFAAAANRLQIDARTLPRIARVAARLYARSGDFTVLHLVTSAYAVRVLLPLVGDPEAAVAAYWRAVAAGVVASRLDLATLARAPAPRPWDELVAVALASDDDHLIKLVDACREEQKAYGGTADWQRAATCVIQRARA